MDIKKFFTQSNPTIFVITILTSLFYNQVHAQQCSTNNLHSAAWGMSPRQAERMLSNAELPNNRNVQYREKVTRVFNHISQFHNGSSVISNADLAQTIVDTSICTGHDFTFLAGILKKESTYCLDRHNENSGASGCGQFTTWPIRVFKNQLLLPGREENGDPDFKRSIETLLSRCYQDRPEKIEEFINLFSQSRSTIRSFLRRGDDIEMDLIASAIYLKFYYARAGFYFNPSSSSPGALSLYGEGSRYASDAMEIINQVDYTCVENEDYLKKIEETSCELSDDSRACQLTVPSYDI